MNIVNIQPFGIHAPRVIVKWKHYGLFGPLVSASVKIFGLWLMADFYKRHGIVAIGVVGKNWYKVFEWGM